MNGGLGVVGGVGANASFGGVIPDAGKLIGELQEAAARTGQNRSVTHHLLRWPYGSYLC